SHSGGLKRHIKQMHQHKSSRNSTSETAEPLSKNIKSKQPISQNLNYKSVGKIKNASDICTNSGLFKENISNTSNESDYDISTESNFEIMAEQLDTKRGNTDHLSEPKVKVKEEHIEIAIHTGIVMGEDDSSKSLISNN
ncbi:unnamed protein product, partial [Meganyctiphanes norvegica]